MSKGYTEDEFSNAITEDRNWRIREISDLKNAIRKEDDGLKKVLLRALVTICYAHWEGYVKFSARMYFDYIARRKIQYKFLDPQFLRNYFLPKLVNLPTSKGTTDSRCDLINAILSHSENRFSKVDESLIDTKSNLNSKVLKDICLVCGISYALFQDKDTFIDTILLSRRNAIAHGEDTMVSLNELDEMAENTISLMRSFGNEIENRIILEKYRVDKIQESA